MSPDFDYQQAAQMIKVLPENMVANGYQTAMFHENRCVGKAVYGIDLDSLNYTNQFLSGVNTTNKKPFEMLLEADGNKGWQGASALMVFCYYDMVVNIRMGNINVLGRT